MNLQLNKEFKNISCSPNLITISECRFFSFQELFWNNLEFIVKYGEQLTSLENLGVLKLKNKTSKLFWSHCGVYIGSGLGGSTCDFWIIAPKGSKLVVLILTLILAWMKDGYFDRNIPHYHLCSKSLAAIYNFTITKTLEFSVGSLINST